MRTKNTHLSDGKYHFKVLSGVDNWYIFVSEVAR